MTKKIDKHLKKIDKHQRKIDKIKNSSKETPPRSIERKPKINIVSNDEADKILKRMMNFESFVKTF